MSDKKSGSEDAGAARDDIDIEAWRRERISPHRYGTGASLTPPNQSAEAVFGPYTGQGGSSYARHGAKTTATVTVMGHFGRAADEAALRRGLTRIGMAAPDVDDQGCAGASFSKTVQTQPDGSYEALCVLSLSYEDSPGRLEKDLSRVTAEARVFTGSPECFLSEVRHDITLCYVAE